MIRYFISSAFRNLWEAKVTSLFTAVTLSVALGFLGTYLAVFMNMKAALDLMSEKFPLSVYLSDHVSQAQLDAVQDRLKGSPLVSGVTYTSKDKALEDFRGSRKDEAALIDSLGTNPLPASLDVALRPDAGPEAAMALVKEVRTMQGVDEVNYMQEEAGKLRSMLASFRIAGLALGLAVLMGVVFISYSTLRLAVLNHSEEIAVMKLMGAARIFIMGPFLLEGLFQGLIAAGLSLGVLYGLLHYLSGTPSVMLLAPGGLAFLPVWAWLGMIASGGLLGLTGSLFAFVRTLRM
ncbi:MAG: hypothetical protein HZA22_04315 [Nitrospirae bacterium]|nr:hypothetical protein [Nitrospirota bacterium]